MLGCIQCTTLCFRSCILFFRNEHAQCTSLGQTKFLGGFVRFRCREVPVVRSGFGVPTMHHFMLPKLRLFFRNEHAQSTTLGPKLSFWVVSRDSVAGSYKLWDRVLGCIQCTTLCYQSCVLFFRNELAQYTSLGRKLSF